MLWQTDALHSAQRLLNTILQAARQAQRDPSKCRIRRTNQALQDKVLWTDVGDDLLRWLGFELSEQSKTWGTERMIRGKAD